MTTPRCSAFLPIMINVLLEDVTLDIDIDLAESQYTLVLAEYPGRPVG